MACRMSFRRLGSLRCSLIDQDFIAVSTLAGKIHQTANGYHVRSTLVACQSKNLTSQQFLQIFVDFAEGKSQKFGYLCNVEEYANVYSALSLQMNGSTLSMRFCLCSCKVRILCILIKSYQILILFSGAR